jgi:hypothetical protein
MSPAVCFSRDTFMARSPGSPPPRVVSSTRTAPGPCAARVRPRLRTRANGTAAADPGPRQQWRTSPCTTRAGVRPDHPERAGPPAREPADAEVIVEADAGPRRGLTWIGCRNAVLEDSA